MPTIPTTQHHRPPAHPLHRTLVPAPFPGCLLGGAIGDALGAPIEFLDRAAIEEQFGAAGITDYAPAHGGLGRITDDTQMTLFTAEGLLRGWVHGGEKDIAGYVEVTAAAYQRWLLTQSESNAHGLGNPAPGWLFAQTELHSRRAPGNTCLDALRAMPRLGEPAHNDSKGCGGVMRVAPVGLFMARSGAADAPQQAFALGTGLCALTHGHPTGSLSGGALAAIICGLATGQNLPSALETTKTLLRAAPDHQETLAAIELAQRHASEGGNPQTSIPRLGEGWVAEEALAISVYCALTAHDFRHGVTLAVNHAGDSDSTGAITGNLLGLMLGARAIPPGWLAKLELRDVIAQIAEDLYTFPTWDLGEHATNTAFRDMIRRRYPEC